MIARFRFGTKWLMVMIAVVSVVLALWQAVGRDYYLYRRREARVMTLLDEVVGHYSLAPGPRQFEPDNRVVRRVQIPKLVTSLGLPVEQGDFLRTTHIAIHFTECLSEPGFSQVPSSASALKILPPDHVRELNQAATDSGLFVDWARFSSSLDRYREFYRATSDLSALEVFKPGPLFGNDDLERFRGHRSLTALDFSLEIRQPAASQATFYSRIDDEGLRLLEDGFPALRYLVLDDYQLPAPLGNATTYRYSQAAIDRLKTKCPELVIIRRRPFPLELVAQSRNFGEWMRPEMKQAVEELNALPIGLKLEPRPDAVAICFVTAARPSAAALADLSHLDYLKAIDLSLTAFDDDQIGSLSRAAKLEFLALEGTPVTERGLADLLAACPKLQALSISGEIVSSPAAIESLRKLPALKYLLLDRTEGASQRERVAAALPHVDVQDHPRVLLNREPGLRYTLRRRMPPWAQTWDPGGGFHCFDVVDEMDLDMERATPLVIRGAAAQAEVVRRLQLKNRGIAREEFSFLRRLPELRELRIDSVPDLTDEQALSWFTAESLPRLETVEIRDCPLSEATILKLKQLPSMTTKSERP